jgi:hypothetical protein
VTIQPIPVGFMPPVPQYTENMPGIPNTDGTKNPFLDQPNGMEVYPYRMAIQSMQDASDLSYEQLLMQLDFKKQLADRGFYYDERDMALRNSSDMQRLGNSRYRDVDLARDGMNNTNAAAYRTLGARLGVANGGFDLDMARLADQLRVGERAFGLGNDNLAFQTGIANRDATNAAAAAGAGTSTGYGSSLSQIRQQDQLSRQGIENAWLAAQEANTTGQQAATLQRDTALRGAQNDWATQQANYNLQSRMIDSVAKDYGVTSSQMQQAMKNGAERLGLDYVQLITEITDSRTSIIAQKKAAADALVYQVMLAAQS